MHFPAPHRRPAADLVGEASPAKSRIWSLLDRFAWLCPLVMLALAATIMAALGLSLWTILLALILLACPLAGLVAWLTGRLPGRPRRPMPARGRRGA